MAVTLCLTSYQTETKNSIAYIRMQISQIHATSKQAWQIPVQCKQQQQTYQVLHTAAGVALVDGPCALLLLLLASSVRARGAIP